jgi:hypothetical protein
MNSLVLVIFILIGLVLIYAAVKNQDPRDIFKQALTKGAR